MYQSIDPAPVRWQKGRLQASGTWQRVGMDAPPLKKGQFRG